MRYDDHSNRPRDNFAPKRSGNGGFNSGGFGTDGYHQERTESKRPGALRRLFGFVGRSITWLRVVLSNLIFILILIFVFLALSPTPTEPLPDEFALRIAPSGFLVEEESYIDARSLLLGAETNEMETPVHQLIDSIDAARDDNRVDALVLELDNFMGGGISKLEEVGAALARFRESGKPIIAVSDYYTQEQYYLASQADEIYIDPMGSVLLTGFASYRTYFKDALDKLAINFHVFRVGRYKDFIEPFTRNDMSQESREHNSEWLNQLWGVFTTRVEQRRQLPAGAIDSYITDLDRSLESVGGNGAQLALESQLVDGVITVIERENMLTERFGFSPYGDFYNSVNHEAYLADVGRFEQPESDGKVGLLIATGGITDGEQESGGIGSETFRQRLQQVREDGDIKALVVRIDSGGGSAFASEVIRAELASLRAEGMPVLVSMGSVAASGGYWIAAGADEIWATPTTLTGSIGVFGAVPTFEDSLGKLGIYVDGVATAPMAGATRLDRELSPQASNVIQQTVNNIYNQFLSIVAEARGMDVERVHDLAQGRVWTGARAHELGLVDQLGSLEEALAAAARHAELENFEVEPITRELTPFDQLIRQLNERQISAYLPQMSTSEPWLSSSLKQQLSPLLAPLRALSEMDDNRAVYARCLVCVAP